MTTATTSPKIIGSKEAVALLDGLVQFAQVHRWIDGGKFPVTQPADGSGSRLGLSLVDVLRLRAVAIIMKGIGGTTGSPSLIIERVAELKPWQLIEWHICLSFGRVVIIPDLTLGEDEQELRAWIRDEWTGQWPKMIEPPECEDGCGCRWRDDADRRECGCEGGCTGPAWVDRPDRPAYPETHIDQLRREWPIDDDHRATRNPNRCDVCAQRMPCDWSRLVADLWACLDELEQQTLATCTCDGHPGTRWGYAGETPQDAEWWWNPECPVHDEDPNDG